MRKELHDARVKYSLGDVGGWCHCRHRSYATAQQCLDRDRRGCKAQGGYGERVIEGYDEHGQRVEIDKEGHGTADVLGGF